jgi:hypothetical protein
MIDLKQTGIYAYEKRKKKKKKKEEEDELETNRNRSRTKQHQKQQPRRLQSAIPLLEGAPPQKTKNAPKIGFDF